MPYSFVADSIDINNFVADFLQVKYNFRRKTVVLRFWPLWGLRDNVRCCA